MKYQRRCLAWPDALRRRNGLGQDLNSEVGPLLSKPSEGFCRLYLCNTAVRVGDEIQASAPETLQSSMLSNHEVFCSILLCQPR